MEFDEAVARLLHGDFSRLERLFRSDGDGRPQILRWYEEGRFADHADALAEALSCACFNGVTNVAEYLLDRGVDPAAGNATGMNAVHWAAERGQLETVRLLLSRNAPLEIHNMYDGTVLGCTIWSAFHEPRPHHLAIIEALLQAGARTDAVEYPTGNDAIDALLRRYRRAT